MRFSKASLRALQAISVGCCVALVILSIVPGNDRPHTGYSGNIEHFIAYAGTALFTSTFLPPMRGWRTVLILSAASLSFEIAQIYIPGRGPGIDNWLASTAGAVVGTVFAFGLASRLWPVLSVRR
jgi:VanZ family protein